MAKSQIIKDLANGNIDTQTALKRTKVLLQEFDNAKLLEWVDCEIQGYPSIEHLPEYRKIDGQLYGTYFKGSMLNYMIHNHVPLPLGNMPDDTRKNLLTANITESIEVLKALIEEKGNDKNEKFVKYIPADYYPYIAQYNDDLGMIIETASVELSMPQILNIFPKVENKLLDILRYLEKQFGNLDELDIDVDSKSEQELKEITNHIYVMIYNDQSITIGDKNKIKNSNIISKIFKQD